MSNFAPSQKRQDWLSISIVFTLILLLSFAGLVYFSWDLETGWPPIEEHLPTIWETLKDLVFRRPLNELEQYMRYIKHYQLEWHLTLHLGLPFIIALFPAYLVARTLYVPGGATGLRYIGGPKLYEEQHGYKKVQKQLKKECKQQKVVPTLAIAPHFTLSPKRTSQNTMVVGDHGSGKTTIIKSLIQQVLARQQRIFIYDEKKEFTSWFYQPEQTLLISPVDRRSVAWDISNDCRNEASAQLIATSMIAENGDDPLWSNGARMLFAGMMMILKRTKKDWGWLELSEMLSMPEPEIIPLLEQYYPRASRFILENNRTTQSFYATLLGSLGFIYSLAEAWPKSYKSGFSIIEWTLHEETRYKTIIVQSDERYRDISAPICNAMISIMTAILLSTQNTFSRELWLCVDELSCILAGSSNQSLIRFLSLSRSKGGRCIAGIQAPSMMVELVDKAGTDSILNLFGNFISLRLGSAGDSAEYVAKAFGQQKVERPSISTNGSGHTVTNWQSEMLPLVTPDDLVHMTPPSKKGVSGYLNLPGIGVIKYRWPLAPLPTIAEENIPAPWLDKPVDILEPTPTDNRRIRRAS